MSWICTSCEFPNSTDATDCANCGALAPVDRPDPFEEEREEYLYPNDPFFD
jgi:hypothetical protein